MKKEIFITSAILAALVACVFLLSGCGEKKYKPMPISYRAAAEDPKIAEIVQKMELDSTCLNCISMSVPAGCCGRTEGKYYGCVSDYNSSMVEYNEGPADYYNSLQVCGGCYCVSFPLYKDGTKPAVTTGCMTV